MRAAQYRNSRIRVRSAAADHRRSMMLEPRDRRSCRSTSAPGAGAPHFQNFDPVRNRHGGRRPRIRQTVLRAAQSRRPAVDLAKTPGINADPHQILHGIAEDARAPIEQPRATNRGR